MGTPFLGEIRPMSFNFPPKGWAQCDGQLLPINQNQALFSLLGTTYGGNGQTTFALPNLRGRLPVGWGGGNALGQAAGSETVTLTPSQIPAHRHALTASRTNASTEFPGYFASTANLYAGPANLTPIGSTPSRAADDRGRGVGAARERDAVLGPELLHRPPGRVPVAQLRLRRDDVESVRRRDPHVRRQLRPPPGG